MPAVTIDEISISTVLGAPAYTVQDSRPKSCPLRVQGRLAVSNQFKNAVLFDRVNIRFCGAVKSRIGDKQAVQDLITLTNVRRPQDFYPAPRIDKALSQSQHLRFEFDVSTATNSKGVALEDTLPPNLRITGSTLVTQSTALTDQRLVRGSCEVVYWIEAAFLWNDKLVGYADHFLDLAPLFRDLPLTASPMKLVPLDVIAKQSTKSKLVRRKQPKVNVDILPSTLLPLSNMTSKQRSVLIPVAISVETEQDQLSEASDPFTCSVEARWRTSTAFSITPLGGQAAREVRGNSVVTNDTTPYQRMTINFPPLCKRAISTASPRASTLYTSVAEMEITIPDIVKLPSISTSLMSKSYNLQLALSINGASSLPVYSARSVIPINVQPLGPEQVTQTQLCTVLGYCGLDDDESNEQLTSPPAYVF